MNQSLKTTIASLALASALALTGCGSTDSSKDTSKTDSKDKTTETASKTEDKKENKVTTDDKKTEDTKTEDTKTESASSDKKTESSSSSDKKTDTSSNKTADNKTSSSSSDKKTNNTSSSKPSSSSSSSSASHTHTWVDDVATKQVQTGTKTVYEEVYHEAVEHQEWVDEGSCYICNVCGEKMYTDNDLGTHFDYHCDRGETFGYHLENFGHYEWVTDTPAYTEKIEKQEPVYETQKVVVGQHCKTCGAKK